MSREPSTPSAWSRHRAVLAISVPIILANVTTPLIGAVDTAVIGQLGAAHLIGAVAVGATLFTLLYWAFGFLRMGTTGLTAQADGADQPAEVAAILARALLIAVAAGLALILLQGPLARIAFPLIDASAAVEAEARGYFAIRIWSAPAALANYALLGWFIGIGRARIALALQVLLNGTNIALDALFVLGLGWGVAGVALGTLMAELAAAFAGVIIALGAVTQRGASIGLAQILDRARVKRLFAVNADIMIRTLCLLFAFTFFTAQGAKAGDLVLAANAVLLHFLQISSYFLDGFAFAAEVLTGKAVGARRRARFREVIFLSSLWAVLLSLALSMFYGLAGGAIIDAMTVSAEVRETARLYLVWAVLAPLAGVACFQLDGIFIGATRTADMRNMMILSLALYLAAWAALTPVFGNHGLWAAVIVFFVVRAVTLGVRFPALERAVFGAVPPRAGVKVKAV